MQFPSMAPLQATLPNPVDTLNLLRNSSFEGESQWMPQQQIPNLVTTIAGKKFIPVLISLFSALLSFSLCV